MQGLPHLSRTGGPRDIAVFFSKGLNMIHYSCDRCRRPLDPEEDLRYVVKIEIQAAMEPLQADDLEDDRDHLLEIQEILERMDDEACEAVSEEVYQKRRFDLCPQCFRQFKKNPLGQEAKAAVDFSQN
jgi:hypothetical protein